MIEVREVERNNVKTTGNAPSGMGPVDIVKKLYAAFADRNQHAILEIFDPEIVWIQNEGFPDEGTHVGAETVINDVFSPFRVDWESWQADVSHWLDAGEAVIALGEYRGSNKATGKSIQSAFAHVYWVHNSRIVRFQQYADALMIARAMNINRERSHDASY